MPLTDAQKRVEKLLPPLARKLRRQQRARTEKTEKAGKEKRVRPRITIEELNKGGIAALKAKGITPKKVQDPDPRGGFEVVLDWIDLPRNLVAQAVGSIAGVDKSKIKERGTFGLKRIRMTDVLDKLGVKQGIGRSVAGFVGDVAIDPLTYLTAGATTGKAISRFLPRAKTSFFKGLKEISKGTAGAIDPNIAKALGGAKRVAGMQKLARRGGRNITAAQFQKKLLSKQGGLLTRSLVRGAGQATARGAAARAALQKGSLSGRKLLRIPFTSIAGPTIPGKQSRAFKALGDVEGFKKLAQASKAPRDVLGVVAQIKNLEQNRLAAKAAKDTVEVTRINKAIKGLRAQARKIGTMTDPENLKPGQFLKVKEPFTTESLRGLAKGKLRLLREGGEAPELLRIRQEAMIGTSPNTAWGRSADKIWGQKASPNRAHEQALTYQNRQGGTDATQRMLGQWQEPTDSLAKAVMDGGLAQDADTARRMLHGAVEYDDAVKGGWNLLPSDPLVTNMANRSALNRIPGVAEYLQKHTLARQQWAKARQGAGLGAKAAPGAELKHLPMGRYASHNARKSLVKQAEGIGTGRKTSATFAGHALQPTDATRTKAIEMFPPNSAEGVPVLTRSNTKINTWANQEWGVKASVVDSNNSVMTINGKLMSQVPMTASEIKAAEKEGMKVIITRFDPSTELVNQMLVKDKKLRTILGYDKAQELTQFFDFDPASAIARQAGQQHDAMTAAGIRDFGKGTGVMVDSLTMGTPQYKNMKIPNALPEGHPLRELIGPGVYDFVGGPTPTALAGGRSTAFPAPVADSMNRLAELYEGGKEMNNFLKVTDATLGWFKRWALFHPAYVTRNVWDNNFGIVMAGGNVGKSAKLGIYGGLTKGSSWRIRNAVLDDTIDALRQSGKRVRLGGANTLEADVAQFLKDHNALQAGRAAAETEPFARDAGRAVSALGKTVGKGKQFANVVRTWNSKVEEYMRIGAFMSFVDDGQPFRQALMNTTLAMPDLANVTKFEQQAMTRIFPWYRWAKNNGARQFFHFIPQKPAFIASIGKLQHLIQGMAPAVPDNLRPEWMREAQAAQISGDEESGSAFMLRNWFPFEEFQALTAGLASPQEATRYIAGSTRPGIKFIAESATGSDIFRQRPTEPFTFAETLQQAPSAFVGGSGTPLDNLLAIRPLREFRRVGEQPDMLGKGLRTLLGGAVQPLSAERGRTEIDLKTRNALAKLRQKINRAQENNDTVEVQSLLRKFMQQQIKRQRTGLKIPKATQQALEQARG